MVKKTKAKSYRYASRIRFYRPRFSPIICSIDRFYACPRFPDCVYSENMSGHSKKKKITDPAERQRLSEKAKKLGAAMQGWSRLQWAEYNAWM